MSTQSQKRQKTHAAVRTSILKRTVRQSVLLSAVTIIILSVLAFLITRSLIEQRVLAQLSSLAAAKEDLIEEVLQRDRERTSLLGQQPDIQYLLKDEEAELSLIDVSTLLLEEGIPILGLSLFDRSGSVIETTGAYIPSPMNGTIASLDPLVGERGWEGHIIYTPVRSSGGTILGVLSAKYEARAFVSSLTDVPTLGDSGEVMLGTIKDGELFLLQHQYSPNAEQPLYLGEIAEQLQFGSPLAMAVSGEEGLGQFDDYKSNPVFAAYRNIPSLGWGLVVKMDVWEAFQGVIAMAKLLLGLGILLFMATSVMAYILGSHLTKPLLDLSSKMKSLRPGHWDFDQSIHSGDEVELLDVVATDLTARLRETYEYLEDEIAARTEDLRQQFIKDRTILETIHHGVVVVDKEGNISDVNPAAIKLMGHDEQKDLVSQNVESVMQIQMGKKSLTGNEHPIIKCIKESTSLRSQSDARYSIVRTDGTIMPIALIVTPFKEDDSEIGAVAVFQDMTEERRVDYVKSEFISLASHQLRTPLSTLKWYIELIAAEDEHALSEGQMEYLNEMTIASERMASLVDSLLNAAGLEGGSIKPKKEDVRIVQLLRDMSEELCSLAKNESVACDINLPEEDVTISTDPILLNIVFQNLIENAVKYSSKGDQIDVQFEKTESTANIIIKDTGMGIPESEHDRIFQKLFRAQNVKKQDTDGNGLGLYITKMIIDNLGGTISFKSKEGEGTEFTVALPL